MTSRSIKPSRMWMTRWARVATRSSWVTSTMVLPWRLSVVNQFQHLLAGAGIEVAGGFVGQDHERIVDQRAGDGHALLLAAGELVGPVVQAVAQPDRVRPASRSGRGRREGPCPDRASGTWMFSMTVSCAIRL